MQTGCNEILQSVLTVSYGTLTNPWANFRIDWWRQSMEQVMFSVKCITNLYVRDNKISYLTKDAKWCTRSSHHHRLQCATFIGPAWKCRPDESSALQTVVMTAASTSLCDFSKIGNFIITNVQIGYTLDWKHHLFHRLPSSVDSKVGPEFRFFLHIESTTVPLWILKI